MRILVRTQDIFASAIAYHIIRRVALVKHLCGHMGEAQSFWWEMGNNVLMMSNAEMYFIEHLIVPC
jgi:hypothetical protein